MIDFQKECEMLHITLKPEDYKSLYNLYGTGANEKELMEIDYNEAIKSIVPVLSKNDTNP